MNRKVSIIVPIYNVEPYLDKCIQSIITQTYYNIEIILIDDGSPDKCGEICDYYAKNDTRIRVIHQLNAGGCAARNVGLESASGEFIMFVDGDDWLANNCVEYLLNLALTTESDMALSKNHYTTRYMEQVSEKATIENWSSEQAIIAIFRPLFAVGCWNKLYRTRIIREQKLCFNVPWYGEGLYFSSIAASYSNHVAVGNQRVYYYRKNNPNSATTYYNVSNGHNALWNSKHIRSIMPIRTNKVMWAINQHIRNNYFEAIMYIIATNSQKKEFKFYMFCWIAYILSLVSKEN